MSLGRDLSNKHAKQLLDTGLDALKTAFKKVAHKAVEATGEFIENKITEKTVKPKHVIDENSRNVVEIIIPPGKRKEKILSELSQVL